MLRLLWAIRSTLMLQTAIMSLLSQSPVAIVDAPKENPYAAARTALYREVAVGDLYVVVGRGAHLRCHPQVATCQAEQHAARDLHKIGTSRMARLDEAHTPARHVVHSFVRFVWGPARRCLPRCVVRAHVDELPRMCILDPDGAGGSAAQHAAGTCQGLGRRAKQAQAAALGVGGHVALHEPRQSSQESPCILSAAKNDVSASPGRVSQLSTLIRASLTAHATESNGLRQYHQTAAHFVRLWIATVQRASYS